MNKFTLLCLSFLFTAAVLCSCDALSSPSDTQSAQASPEPTITLAAAAPEPAQAPEEELSMLFYKDDSLTVTKTGNKYTYTFNEKYQSGSFELSSARNYTDVQVILKDGRHYFVAADDNGCCAIGYFESGINRIRSSDFDTYYLEFNGRRFYFDQIIKLTAVTDSDGKIIGVYYNKFKTIELKNGTAVLNYYAPIVKGEEGEIENLHLCDPETLEPLIFENDSNYWVYNTYLVNDGLMYLEQFSYQTILRIFDGEDITDYQYYRVIYKDKDYFLIEIDYHNLRLYDREMNLLCDWGYVDNSKNLKFSRDGDRVTVALDNYDLTYPIGDVDIGDTFYETDKFKIIRDGSDWYLRDYNRNYLIPIDVQSEAEPFVGQNEFSDINHHYYFFWKDASKAAEVSIYESSVFFHFTPQLVNKYDWNGFEVCYLGDFGYIFDENGELVLFDVGIFEVKNNFLAAYMYGEWGDMYQTYYRSDMTPLTDRPFFKPCDSPTGYEGGVMGIVGNHFEIFDADGNLVKKSRDFDMAMLCTDGYTLALDGEKLKLFDMDENEVAVFEDYYTGLQFHPMLSGYYKKSETNEYPAGYYFVFADASVMDENHYYLDVEFYYDPETKESGTVKYFGSFDYAKPVLYLYPEEMTEVTVQFEHPERLTTVYPAYNDGWTVTASPDGNLFDGRRNYYALYWEENSDFIPDFRTGFIVENNYDEFLEEKLDEIGLSEREANEFIMYWLPILEKNGKSIVHFELTESRENNNKLLISPAPDSLLRVAIHIKKADGSERVIEQQLEHFERTGFTAVEWGGRVYD